MSLPKYLGPIDKDDLNKLTEQIEDKFNEIDERIKKMNDLMLELIGGLQVQYLHLKNEKEM